MLLKFDVKVGTIAAAVLTFAVATSIHCSPATAQMVPSTVAKQATKTEFASRMFTSAMGRIARGEPADAVRLLDVLAEIAPDLPELHYSRGLALTLADFDGRAQAVPALDRALAADPANPLYALVRKIADPRHSALQGSDLHVSAELAGQLVSISQRLTDSGNARSAKFLGRAFAGLEQTGHRDLPYRLPGFAGMIGEGGFVKIAAGAAPVALGQLLALTIPSDRFAPYEANLVARVEARATMVAGGQSPRAVQLAQKNR